MSESERTKVMVLGTDHLAHIEGGVPAGALTDLLGAIEAYPIEGVGLVARLAPDGSQSAGMGLMQPPSGPLIDMDAVERGDEKTKEAKDGKPDLDDPDVKELLRFQAMQFARIAVFAEEKSATIGLQDSQGRQRLLLQVDENDNPAIILYDAEGKETARFPEAKN